MDDSQPCGRAGFSGGASDWRRDRMGHSRHTCHGDHCLVLPCLLHPFGGPCASMAAIAALTLKRSGGPLRLLPGEKCRAFFAKAGESAVLVKVGDVLVHESASN